MGLLGHLDGAAQGHCADGQAGRGDAGRRQQRPDIEFHLRDGSLETVIPGRPVATQLLHALLVLGRVHRQVFGTPGGLLLVEVFVLLE